ncbi:MAG: c-type cytochrome [Bergeyella sp.]|nr:c-type cytochrome [Bergeyella sp.]
MKQRTPLVINILIILILLFTLFYMIVQGTEFVSSPYFWGTVLISILFTFIQHSIGDLIENNRFKKLSPEEKKRYIEEKKIPYLKRLYSSAFKKQSRAEEEYILIDHGFDGILELDNQLPKWWLGLFWFGVAFCIIYMMSYSFTDFAHPKKEYDKAYKKQMASIQEYMKLIPQATLETAVYNKDLVKEGEAIFNSTCVTCHGERGKGLIGPNLTDDYWINQPENTLFKNIFYIVENGSPNNPAMQAFGKNGILTGNKIEAVASYVYHINQEKPPITVEKGGKAPEGTKAQWKNE